jgi:hypothetical protein
MCFPLLRARDNVFFMNPSARTLALAVFLAAAVASPAAEPNFTPLFNGKDLTHFKAVESKEFWRVEDGVLIGENNAAKKENYLWTEKEYGDFVLEFDARWKGTTDRGVDTGVEAKERKSLLKPEGEWNTFRIQAKGDTFTCWINGQKASEYTDAKFSGAAPLGFQVHGGVVMKCEYRNLKIAEL